MTVASALAGCVVAGPGCCPAVRPALPFPAADRPTPVTAVVSGVDLIDGKLLVGCWQDPPPPPVAVTPGVHQLGFSNGPLADDRRPAALFTSLQVELSAGTRYDCRTGGGGAGYVEIRNATTGRTTYIDKDLLVYSDAAGRPLSVIGPFKP